MLATPLRLSDRNMAGSMSVVWLGDCYVTDTKQITGIGVSCVILFRSSRGGKVYVIHKASSKLYLSSSYNQIQNWDTVKTQLAININSVIVRLYLIDVFRSFRFQYELLMRGGAVGERGS
jgi:hypothetical protein